VIDVSTQSRSTASPTDSPLAGDGNKTLIHILELIDRINPRPPTPLPLTTVPTTPARPSETAHVRPGRPLAIYFPRQEARRGVVVLELVPALTALRDGEKCAVTAGDRQRQFVVVLVDAQSSLWSLQFRHGGVQAGVYRIQLSCWPLMDSSLQSGAFSFNVELRLY